MNTQLKPVLERHGARNQRMWQVITGPGDAPYESFSWTAEFDSFAAYGQFLDDIFADQEFQAAAAQLFSPDSPGTQLHSTVESEIDF